MLHRLSSREQFENELADRKSPVLRDGTALGDLIDFRRREIKMRVLNDPELHQLELRRVFARAWIVVGHASEIPNAGDYVKRFIGQDAVIVTRDRNGDVRILLNACSHRGMELCWADQGNQTSFKCPYHGWVFDQSGNLMGAPFEKEMYGVWDKSQYGLKTAHVAVRHGVIFGSFATDPQPFDEWLGEFGWYFDTMYGSAELEALLVAGPTMRVAANWKASAEQNCGDGYHTVTLHHALVELGMMAAPTNIQEWSLDCYDVSSFEGHGLRVAEMAHSFKGIGDKPDPFPIGWFVSGSMFPGIIVSMTASKGGGMAVNANSGLVGQFDAPLYGASLGGLSPRGPTAYEQWGIRLFQKSAPEAVKESVRRQFVLAPVGAIPDDYETWPSMTRVAEGAIGREQTIKYNTVLGANNPADFPDHALVHRGVSKDDNQWHFWLRWYELMTDQEQA